MSDLDLNDLAKSMAADKDDKIEAPIPEFPEEAREVSGIIKEHVEGVEKVEKDKEGNVAIRPEEFSMPETVEAIETVKAIETDETPTESIEEVEEPKEESEELIEEPYVPIDPEKFKTFALNVLDDEYGINEKAYDSLKILLQSSGFNEIIDAVDVYKGRAIIGEDEAEEMRS